MQQDCQLGIPPPSSHLAILILSLPLCRLSFYLSSSLPLPSPPPSPSILVSLITIQQTAAEESAEMTHNTLKQEPAHTPPLHLPPSDLFSVAAADSSTRHTHHINTDADTFHLSTGYNNVS
ncbi:hypothetical protein ILYODFUR_027444 [Ilyodon furcidens]|uniref:Uncharacterized protein n=1 Tax=Ilyodon furcidens TaxID=33524 RepID=A0ABV0T2B1_9TELE